MRIKRMNGALLAGRKNNRLFLKILFCFLSLLVSILIVGIGTYLYSAQVIKKDFNDKISVNLQSAADTVDLYIKTAQETSLSFFYDEVVQRIMRPKAGRTLPLKAEQWKIPRIIQKHENIVSEFVDRIFVYMDDEEVYVNNGVNSFPSFFGWIYQYEAYDPAFWREKLGTGKAIEFLPVSPVLEDKSLAKRVVPIVIRERLGGGGSAIMVLNIAIDSIRKTLAGNAVFESTEHVVLDGSGHLLYDSGGYAGDPGWPSAVAALSDGTEGAAEVRLGQSKYRMTYIKSGLYGWEYYSVTPSSEFKKHIAGILFMTVLLCFILIVMGVVVSFVFSFHIYNPIRNLRDIVYRNKELWKDEGEAEQPANEFELIRYGISQMAERHLRYKSKYDQYSSDYVEYSLLFLLKGHTINQEDILRDTLRNEFGFGKSGYLCCALYFDFRESFYQEIQDTERDLIAGGIKTIIWQLLNERLPAYVMQHRHNLYVCVVNMDDAGEIGLLTQAFAKLRSVFEYDIRHYYGITIGRGTLYASVNDIGASYNEAMTAIDKHDKEEGFQIVESDHLMIENRYYYSLYDEQKILNNLNLFDADGVSRVVEDIIDRNAGKEISYEHMRLLIRELYATGTRFLAEKGIKPGEFERQNPGSAPPRGEKEEEAYAGTSALKRTVTDYYRTIIEATRHAGGSKTGVLVSMIEKFIQEHYTEDLGLERIADEMGVSVKYISRVFIERTGIYLTDYINKVRIDKAKQPLLHTDMKVKDIPGEIGINGRTTFLRVFKKVEGITPNDYRNLHRADQQRQQ